MLNNKIQNIPKGEYFYASRLAYNCLSECSFFDYLDKLIQSGNCVTLLKYLEKESVDKKLLKKYKNFCKNELNVTLFNKEQAQQLLI